MPEKKKILVSKKAVDYLIESYYDKALKYYSDEQIRKLLHKKIADSMSKKHEEDFIKTLTNFETIPTSKLSVREIRTYLSGDKERIANMEALNKEMEGFK